MPFTGTAVCIAIALLFLTALLMAACRDSRRFIKVRYSLGSDRLHKDCRILLLSDLHNKSFGKDNEKLVRAIEKSAPDLILIAGDMLTANEEKTRYDTPLSLLKTLSESWPVYYANGNHEYRMKVYKKGYGSMYEDYKRQLLSYGVRLLENERVFLPAYNLELCGLEIERYYYKRFYQRPMGEDYLERLLGKSRPDCLELLIAHNPDYFKQYAAWGADLTVSGHVHGGVVRLPFLGGVISPMLRLFPRYDGGLYEEKGKKMILSRGLGMHTIPLRIFNPGELVEIHLKAT